MIDLRDAAPGRPEWWLRRLLGKLWARRSDYERWQRYYDGEQPMAVGDRAFREAFGDRFRRFASNFIQLVVDGQSERMAVQAFRFTDPRGDADLWRIWQDNDLDSGSQAAHTSALIKGSAYVLVERQGDGLSPLITVEDASDAIVEVDPKRRSRRLAGLKCWTDDETGRLMVYVYDEEAVYKFQSATAWPPTSYGVQMGAIDLPIGTFERLVLPGEDWPEPHRLGRVPLVPLLNRPGIKGIGRSEVDAVASNQDKINYARTAGVIAMRYMAVPQRGVLNFDVEVDKDTGRPKRPFVTADGRPGDLWTIGNPDPDGPVPPFPPQFYQFPPADLKPFIDDIQAEVWQMAAISRMPYQELLGQPSAIPQSGEALKASESPLIRKVGQAQEHFGQGWEEVMRLSLRAKGDLERADIRDAETVWANAETRNEAVRTDAVVKLHQAGIIDDEAAWEMIGMSPQQIERMRQRQPAPAPEAPEPPVAIDMAPAPTGMRMSPLAGEE